MAHYPGRLSPIIPERTLDPQLPIYVSHRGAQNVWLALSCKQTIFANYAIEFGDPNSPLVIVVDSQGWPVENMYGFGFKEYEASNTAPVS